MSDTNDCPKSFDACGFMFKQVASITEWQDRALSYQKHAIEAEKRAQGLERMVAEATRQRDEYRKAIDELRKKVEALQAINDSQGDRIAAQSRRIVALLEQRDEARKEATDLHDFNRDLQETIAATTVHTHVHTFDIENMLDLVRQLKQQGE